MKRFGIVGVLATMAAVASVLGGAQTGLAASEIAVDCGGGADLQAAINAAPRGAILDISGTCRGNFTVGKKLSLRGVSAAVLDAQGTGTTLTVTGASVRVTKLTVTGGSIDPGSYGIDNAGSLTVVRATVQGNEFGGVTNRGTLVVQRSQVISNGTDEDGVGIANIGTAKVEKSNISSNWGSGIASGSWGNAPGALTVVDSTVSNNGLKVVNGGGIWNGIHSVATILRSTITKNWVGNDGPGGVGNAGTMTIIESTISDNFGDGYSGGLFTFDGGSTTIVASILSANMYDNLASDCGGPLISGGYNVIGSPVGDEDCAYTARATDQTNVLDPGLNPLANRGGPTQTMVPKTSSPVVNKIPVGATSTDGTIALCPSSGTTDQRGISRPQGGSCDVGSVERKPKD